MSSLSQFFSGGQKVQLFTTSGVWVCPSPNTKVHVLAIGGGGQGTDFTSGGSAGGSSSFGALLSVSGGSGAVDNSGALGFNIGQSGFRGSSSAGILGQGGQGAPGLYGFGNGGNGVAVLSNYVGGGGGSGYVSTYSGTVSTDQVVTVGAGGGSGLLRGGSGAVIVWWE